MPNLRTSSKGAPSRFSVLTPFGAARSRCQTGGQGSSPTKFLKGIFQSACRNALRVPGNSMLGMFMGLLIGAVIITLTDQGRYSQPNVGHDENQFPPLPKRVLVTQDPPPLPRCGPGGEPIVVRNNRESWGTPQFIKFDNSTRGKPGRTLFNPTVIPMPENSTHRYVAVVRTGKWTLKHDNREYTDAHIVGCLLDDGNGTAGDRYITCATPAVDLDIPLDWRGTDERYYNLTAQKKKPSFWEYFVGPEDPRLFWSLDGRPIMLYAQVNPQGRGLLNLKSQWLTDLRVVMPGLDDALPQAYKLHSIPAGMYRENLRSETLLQDVEKNWVPFYSVNTVEDSGSETHHDIRTGVKDSTEGGTGLDKMGKRVMMRRLMADAAATGQSNDDLHAGAVSQSDVKSLYFVTRYRPYVVYRYGAGGYIKALKPRPADEAANNCFERLMMEEEKRPGYTHGGTSPVLVTLCKRGDCKPTVSNSVFLAVLHVLDFSDMEGRWYRRYAVTWNSTSPFLPISISPPVLVFGLQARGGILFDTTISYTRRPPVNFKPEMINLEDSLTGTDNMLSRKGFDHGYLNDEVIVSLGIGDRQPLVFYSTPKAFLKRHAICGDHVSQHVADELRRLSRKTN